MTISKCIEHEIPAFDSYSNSEYPVETVARIRGVTAFRMLAQHWLSLHRESQTETVLCLLADAIESLARKVPKIRLLRESIVPYLENTSRKVRSSAARCILALGARPNDKKALTILADTFHNLPGLPACLRYRKDLITYLLCMNDIRQIWGLQLAVLFRTSASMPVILSAVRNFDQYGHLHCIVDTVLKIKDQSIIPDILGLYLRTPVAFRKVLNPLLRIHKKQIRSLLIDLDIDDETRLVISAYVGIPPVCIALEILDLQRENRILVIEQIAECRTILKYLPWSEWLEHNPEIYGSVAAEVAVKSNLKGLLLILRKILSAYPIPQIIRSVGAFRDQESRNSISNLLTHEQSKPFAHKVYV
jgi:hypothetical protein